MPQDGITITLDEGQAVADLAKKGCLVWLRVKRPSLSRMLSPDALGLPPSITGLATSPKVLPPGTKFKEFAKIEMRARQAIEKRALSRGDVKFVPFGLLDELHKEVVTARNEYFGVKELFLRDYARDVAKGLTLWETESKKIWNGLDPSLRPPEGMFTDAVLRAVREAWPKEEDLADRFDMRMSVLQFALPGIASGVAQEAAVVADVTRNLARESLTGFYSDLVSELRARTVEMSDQIVKSLDGPRFGENSLKSLRAFLNKFEALNVCDDREIEARINEIKAMLGNKTSEDVRGDKNFRETFRTTLVGLRDEGTKLLTDAEKDAASLLNKRYGSGIRKVV